MPEVKLQFTREKETPGTVRFQEKGDPDKHTVGTLYIKKTAKDLASRQDLTVTIEGK